MTTRNSSIQYSVGDRIQARINKINDNGCYCSFVGQGQLWGFMPNYLMSSFFDGNGDFTKGVGDIVDVIIWKFSERGFLLSDALAFAKEQKRLQKRMEKEYEQTLIDDFASKFEIGTVFDVMVTKVKDSNIMVAVGAVILFFIIALLTSYSIKILEVLLLLLIYRCMDNCRIYTDYH